VIGVVAIPLGLWVFRARRAVREATREAEAVGMIRRRVTTESRPRRACVEIFNAVDTDVRLAIETCRSAGTGLSHAGGGYLYLADSTVQRRAYSMVRVHPEARRRGHRYRLLEVAREEAGRMGKDGIWGRVECDDQESRGWLLRRGFQETLQDVELVRRSSR
jgi:GNAT superfamily N-acetyltransferase